MEQGGTLVCIEIPWWDVFAADDDVYYYVNERMGVCTRERSDMIAVVLMSTSCTNSLGGGSGEAQAWRR